MPANAFGPADVGRVVTLRLETRVGPADVVGTLVSVSADEMVVRRRDGALVTLDVRSVTHARLVPPAVAQSIRVAELERVMADGWRATETEQLGGWLLRASGGFTRRGNSALPLGEPGRPLDEAVVTVERWYAERGLPPRVQLPVEPAAAELAAAMTARGWRREMAVHVMTAELAPVLRASREQDTDLPGVQVDEAPADDWLAVYRSEAGPLPDVGPRELLVNHPSVGFVAMREAGECVAIARVSIDARWAGLFAVEVSPAHRRRGLGRAVSLAALRWAARHGARRTYLQVVPANVAATTLYGGLGFDVHHDYEHYVRESAGAEHK